MSWQTIKRHPKWIRGDAITTEDELVRAIHEHAVVFVFNRFRGRPVSVHFVANQSWSVVRYLIAHHHIVLAVRNPEVIS